MSLFQQALDCIEMGDEEEILRHRDRALKALRKLERVLLQSHRDEPGLLPGPLTVEPLYDEAPARLLDSLDRFLTKIYSYARKAPEDAVAAAPQEREDPRVIDAQIYYGASRKTPALKFRSLLGTRSLGIEFMNFQRARRGYSRVDRQVNYLSEAADQTQDATVDDFIQEYGKHISDHGTAKRMIAVGTKLLVLEGLIGHCGLSSLLWQVPKWHTLRYSELPQFLEVLLQTPRYHRVRTAAEDLSGWYELCQNNYDQKIMLQKERLLPMSNRGHEEGGAQDQANAYRPNDAIQPENNLRTAFISTEELMSNSDAEVMSSSSSYTGKSSTWNIA